MDIWRYHIARAYICFVLKGVCDLHERQGNWDDDLVVSYFGEKDST